MNAANNPTFTQILQVFDSSKAGAQTSTGSTSVYRSILGRIVFLLVFPDFFLSIEHASRVDFHTTCHKVPSFIQLLMVNPTKIFRSRHLYALTYGSIPLLNFANNYFLFSLIFLNFFI